MVRRLMIIFLLSFVAISANAQTAKVPGNLPDKPLINGEYFIESSMVSRLNGGGVNVGGVMDQIFSCTYHQLINRQGNCSIIPEIPDRGNPVYTKDVSKGPNGECQEGVGTGICEYIPEWNIWRYASEDVSKSTFSNNRIDWFKNTPTQAAAQALSVTNAAPGDMMAQVISLFDLAGARSKNDEGDMLIRGQFRDWGYTPYGLVSGKIEPQNPDNLTYSSFDPIVFGERQLHWSSIGPSRLIIFLGLDYIPIEVEKQGTNPYLDEENGGAIWKLSEPLPKSLRTRNQPNGMSRTDYCLTLNANEYQSMVGPERQFLQVAKVLDQKTIVTNFVRDGKNLGIPSWYVNGYKTVDEAVSLGNHTSGLLIPCSVIRRVVFPDTSTENFEMVQYTLSDESLEESQLTGEAPKEGTLIIEPMTEIEIPEFTQYRIPASGMYSQQSIKFMLDQRLGSGGDNNGFMVVTESNEDSRPGTIGLFVGSSDGIIPQTRKNAGYPYSWEKGLDLQDIKHPIVIHNSALGKKKPAFLFGAADSDESSDILYFNYNQPEDFSEVVLDPPPGMDNYIVTVTIGEGEPSPKTCSRPGIERYYQTDTDSEWICSSNNQFKNHSCILCW